MPQCVGAADKSRIYLNDDQNFSDFLESLGQPCLLAKHRFKCVYLSAGAYRPWIYYVYL